MGVDGFELRLAPAASLRHGDLKQLYPLPLIVLLCKMEQHHRAVIRRFGVKIIELIIWVKHLEYYLLCEVR